MVDLSTYWKNSPDTTTPVEASVLNGWGGEVEAIKAAAQVSANAAAASAAAAAAPADDVVAAFIADATPSATRAQLNARYSVRGDMVLNVKDYGALGNGVADDTAAIQAALDAVPPSATQGGAHVYFPPGRYQVTTLTVSVNATHIIGVPGASRLQTTSATADLLVVPNTRSGCSVYGLAFSSSVTRTAGYYVNNDSSGFRLDRYFMDGAQGGVRTTGTAVTIERGSQRNAVPTGLGIVILGGFDVSIRDIVMDQAVNQASGIVVTSTGDCAIEDCNIIRSGSALNVNPGAGQTVASLWVSNTFLDTSNRGLYISVAGNVVRAKFTDVWFSSHTTAGIQLQTSGAGVIDGVEFNGCHMFLNASDGLKALSTAVKNVRWNGGAVAGNTGAGFTFAAGVSDWSVQNCRIGNSYGIWFPNAYPIYVTTGASARYMVTGNDMTGNTNVMFDGGTGTKVVANNLT